MPFSEVRSETSPQDFPARRDNHIHHALSSDIAANLSSHFSARSRHISHKTDVLEIIFTDLHTHIGSSCLPGALDSLLLIPAQNGSCPIVSSHFLP